MKKAVIMLLSVLVVFIAGCAQSIGDVKDESNVGEKVTVKGTVEETISIGGISGYILLGEDGERISVESESLPAEGDEVRITGTLESRPIIGYVIVADE